MISESALTYIAVVRWILPVLAVIFIILLRKLLIYKRPEPPVLANLMLPDGQLLPVTSCESIIGRSRKCEILLPLSNVSRQHAVLTYKGEHFSIKKISSRCGLKVNGEETGKACEIYFGDEILISDVRLILRLPEDTLKPSERDIYSESVPAVKKPKKTKKYKEPSPIFALLMLSAFQLLAMCELFFTRPDNVFQTFLAFLFLITVQWAYCVPVFFVNKITVGPELAAFFLSTLGMCVTVSAAPGELFKQCAAIACGIAGMIVINLILRNLRLVMRLRYFAGVAAIMIFILNLILGSMKNGAKNWIDLGFVTIQPSEFVKIVFIFSSSMTLEWLMSKRNMILLTAFSGVCIGMLFIMNDFGTAVIFFITFIIIAYLSSGNLLMVGGAFGAAALGGAVIVNIKPHIFRRFEAWRNVFYYANSSGFQQTRTLIAISGGGLLGVGGGLGFLRQVSAADTDLVFGLVSEEWGFIIALCAAATLILLMMGAIRNSRLASSSYYAIAGCAAAGMFLFQSALNIFGSTDILPLTGVTFVFISNGGSSVVACWCLLAFIKSVYIKSSEAQREVIV